MGVLPIGVSLLLLVILHSQETTQSFESPLLFAALNTLFLGAIPLALAYLAAKSYSSSGDYAYLMVGFGLLFLGSSSLLAGWLRLWTGRENPTETLHNLGSLLTGLFLLLGAHFFLQELVSAPAPKTRVRHCVLLYAGIMLLVVVIAALAYQGKLPPFFDHEHGPSYIRQYVLGSAILLFVVAGLLFIEIYAALKTEFAYWYGLALWLIAAGLAHAFFQHAMAGWMGWIGRGTQYIGSLYFLLAFLQGMREQSTSGEPGESRSTRLLWPYLERRINERTAYLTELNEALQKEIAERQQAEAARRRSEDKFSKAFHTSPDSININRLSDGLYINVNQGFTELTGYTAEEVIGRTSLEINIWADPQDRARLVRGLRESGEVKNLEALFRFKDGKVRSGLMSAKVIEIDGELCILSIARDISERKQAEEQVRRALAEKEALLRELYHRTKNNMGVIVALLDLQAAVTGDERLQEAFAETKNRIHSMALVHQKLYEAQDLSRINLKEYVSDLASLLINSYRVSPGKLVTVCELEDVWVLIDTAIPCGLVLNELFSNALKHAFPGERSGEIRVRLSHTGDGEVCLMVADNGVGIPPGFDFRNNGRLGLQNIFVLVENQLLGEVNFVSEAAHPGLSCEVRFRDNLYTTRV